MPASLRASTSSDSVPKQRRRLLNPLCSPLIEHDSDHDESERARDNSIMNVGIVLRRFWWIAFAESEVRTVATVSANHRRDVFFSSKLYLSRLRKPERPKLIATGLPGLYVVGCCERCPGRGVMLRKLDRPQLEQILRWRVTTRVSATTSSVARRTSAEGASRAIIVNRASYFSRSSLSMAVKLGQAFRRINHLRHAIRVKIPPAAISTPYAAGGESNFSSAR